MDTHYTTSLGGEPDDVDTAERSHVRTAVASWVASSLAAAYVTVLGEPLPRELVELLPKA